VPLETDIKLACAGHPQLADDEIVFQTDFADMRGSRH
jgi:hypothetical protein